MTPTSTLPASLPVGGQSQQCTIIRCTGEPGQLLPELPHHVTGYRAVHECRASITWSGPCRAMEFDALGDALRHERDHTGGAR